MDKLADAKNTLAGCAQDADLYNAMGVIALRENNLSAAAEYFGMSNNATAKENAAAIDILKGNYKAAAQKLAGVKSYNAALAQLLNGNYAPAAAFECECPKAAYLRAVAAARQGNASAVKTNLEAAKKDAKLAEKAAKDVEFALYR